MRQRASSSLPTERATAIRSIASKMTLVVWTNLTVSLDGKVTADSIMLKVLDQIYVVSPLR